MTALRLEDVPNCLWTELLMEDWGGYQPPFTVHLPIQPAYSTDLVHVDCAFNVCRRRVVEHLDSTDSEGYARARQQQVLLVQFAFGEQPAVPDFRRCVVSLEEGKWPLATVEYYALEGLLYSFKYFCRPLPGGGSLLWVVASVHNRGEATQPAHVWARVGFPREEEIFDYHYHPFFWDATKYGDFETATLVEKGIVRQDTTIGKVEPKDFEVVWQASADFSDADYRWKGIANPTLWPLRYKNVRDAMHFRCELEPGQTKEFALSVLVDFEAVSPEHLELLKSADAHQDREAARQQFANIAATTSLVCETANWGDIFAYLPVASMQLLMRYRDGSLVPNQGGSSERHFVWVWESIWMLAPLLRLGYSTPVREALEFVFSLQDSGHPPEGKLASTEGAVGTTGPKWLCTTGAALDLAADYYLHTRDETFETAFLPRVLRAMHWVAREIKATRKLNPDGSRPQSFGLMPFGVATDGDTGNLVAFTDAYTYRGFEKAVLVLEQLGHAEAAEFRRELDQYRNDLLTTIGTMTRADGHIECRLKTGEVDEVAWQAANNSTSAVHYGFCNVMEPDDPSFLRFAERFERNLAHGLFVGQMDCETMYTGSGELPWQEVYLRLGEWKKAFAVTQINLKYGMTQDAHQVQERFRLHDAAFCPWQPNGSGNGRALTMMLNALYFEAGETATLFGCFPWAWLESNGITALKKLRTARGMLSLEATVNGDCCRLKLNAEGPEVFKRFLRLPEHLQVATAAEGMLLQGDGVYQLPAGVSELEFVVKNGCP